MSVVIDASGEGSVMRTSVICVLVVGICSFAAGQDQRSRFAGSKAGDRQELAPGIAFRWCPAGTFRMGDGKKAVDVELSRGYWLGETEVTQGQWQKLMGTTPWIGSPSSDSMRSPPPDIKTGPGYPASYVSFDDARSFCEKLTTQERVAGRLPESWSFALPTEAQWEYACRAGTSTRFSFGDNESELGQYGWFRDQPDHVAGGAHQVGLKKSNAWGLRDMHGNLWEWCHDSYADAFAGKIDPVGPLTGTNRVIRGGSWLDVADGCRSANRFYFNPNLGNGVVGFRITASAKQ